MANTNNSKDLSAMDLTTARLTQGLALLGLVENDVLDRATEGEGLDAEGLERIAQSLWGIKALLVQAQAALRDARPGAVQVVLAG